jgi:hydroxymethylbilane synthase
VKKRTVVVGSRGSRLALVQTGLVVDRLKAIYPDIDLRVKTVRTTGDRDPNASLAQIGGEGLFVKELEGELAGGGIDFAVHSLKDLPTELDSRFTIAAVCLRVDPRDALVSRRRLTLSELDHGAHVGTGSERRSAQIKAIRPDIVIEPLRGNIDTRLKKLESDLDGIVVAAAAMLRMGWGDLISEYLATDHFLPAAGQGALAVETLASDVNSLDLLGEINEEAVWQAAHAEKAFLRMIGGGCRAPIAALGAVDGDDLHLDGMIARGDGTRMLRRSERGLRSDWEGIAGRLAEKLRLLGARELMDGRER